MVKSPNCSNYYVIAPVEGLNLTTDLVVGQAILIGAGPEYRPIPGITQTYEEPHRLFGSLLFAEYSRLSHSKAIHFDGDSLEAVRRLPHGRRMGDAACICYDITLGRDVYTPGGAV